MQIICRAVRFISEPLPQPNAPRNIQIDRLNQAVRMVTSTSQMFTAATPNVFNAVITDFVTFLLLQRSLFFHLTPRLTLCGILFNDKNLSEVLEEHLPHIQSLTIMRVPATDAFVQSTVMRMSNLTEFYSCQCPYFTQKSVATLQKHPNGPTILSNFKRVCTFPGVK